MDIQNTAWCFQQNQQNKEKSLEVAKLIQRAAKEIHANMAAQKECQELRDAQRMSRKDDMWRILQKHLRQYVDQIKQTAWLTGLTVVPVDQAFYDVLTIPDVHNQIELLIGAIHAIRVNKTEQTAFKECLKKLMKNSRLFSKQEIGLICPDRSFRT